MFSRFFIDRPIFATVVSLLIVLAGIVSINNLSVEQYPNLTPPNIVVEAQYPGGSADTISETVIAPLEQKINGVEDMIYMNSAGSSNSGRATINVFFKVGTDPDMAMININNRVQQANSLLPEIVKKYGVTVSKKSPAILSVLSFYCDNGKYDSTFVGNYVALNVVDALKRIEGVGDAMVMNGNDYAMRIWLKPDKLAQLKLSTSEIAAAISGQNVQRTAGSLGKNPMPLKIDRSYVVRAHGRYTSEEEFGNIIIRANRDGTALRMKDIADIELGPQSYDMVAKTKEGIDAAVVMISLSPGANALDTERRVQQKLDELRPTFPEGIKDKETFNTTTFVTHSVNEVVQTLFEAIVLVFLVILLFLKNLRATIIPCLAVPVSIIGTFAGMFLFGFSINSLTLFGLVLAIGIVVDDAIVVIENVERIMRTEKLPVREATIKAMDEVTGALIGIVLVLCAVFVPVSFMGGMAGVMYKQFAITIAVSVVISGLCALTLTPALCVVFLKNNSNSSAKLNQNKFFSKFDEWFERLTNFYMTIIAFVMQYRAISFAIIIAIVLSIAGLFHITPTGLVPKEDQGNCLVAVSMDPATSIRKTEKFVSTVVKNVVKDKCVRDCMCVAGYDLISGVPSDSAGILFTMLQDWSERKGAGQSVDDVTRRINIAGLSLPGGLVYAFTTPAIIGMSTTGGFEGYVQRLGDMDSRALEQKATELVIAANKRPELSGVRTTFSASVPQLELIVDDLKAMAFGVALDEIYSAIGATFNTFYVNDFSKYGRGFKVIMQAKGKYRGHPGAIDEIYVKSNTGEMIPVSAFARLEPIVGPIISERFNIFQAAKIMGNPAPGYSSGQAIQAMEEVARSVLGNDYSLSWTGSAYQEKENGGSSNDAVILGLIVVFLVLAALYEWWSLPFAVLMAVPFAMFGAILAISLRGLDNDIYFQVAMITLVGLSSKNAILIVEFAVMLREQGASIIEAAIRATKLRFRPIVMTSLAFILGVVPLAISSGAGSASRHAIGTSVLGGMLSATLIAPLFIPLFYVIVTTLSEKIGGKNVKTQG